eukprot:2140774-Rhodomonas_salina.2
MLTDADAQSKDRLAVHGACERLGHTEAETDLRLQAEMRARYGCRAAAHATVCVCNGAAHTLVCVHVRVQRRCTQHACSLTGSPVAFGLWAAG